jgi:zinc transporter 5/7
LSPAHSESSHSHSHSHSHVPPASASHLQVEFPTSNGSHGHHDHADGHSHSHTPRAVSFSPAASPTHLHPHSHSQHPRTVSLNPGSSPAQRPGHQRSVSLAPRPVSSSSTTTTPVAASAAHLQLQKHNNHPGHWRNPSLHISPPPLFDGEGGSVAATPLTPSYNFVFDEHMEKHHQREESGHRDGGHEGGHSHNMRGVFLHVMAVSINFSFLSFFFLLTFSFFEGYVGIGWSDSFDVVDPVLWMDGV